MASPEAPPQTRPTAEEREAERALKKQDRVSIWKAIPWSTPTMSMSALVSMTSFFTIYATDTLHLNIAVVGGLLVAVKVIDAIGALLAGYLVDRAPETRWGKARPFDLTVIACWALTAFMFSAPGALGDVAKYVWIFTSYLLLTALFMPLFGANSPLFTSRVFPRREHYTDMGAKGAIVVVVVSICITIAMPIAIGQAGKDPAAWSLVAISIAIPATLLGLVRFWLFREDPKAAVVTETAVKFKDIFQVLRHNPYIWVLSGLAALSGIYGGIAAGTYYFRYIVGDISLMGVASVSGIVIIPIMIALPALVRRFSISRLIAFGCFIGTAGFMLMSVAGSNLALIIVAGLMTAMSALPVAFLAPILVLDNSTYNEWKGLRRLESVGGAVFTFATTVGGALAVGIAGAVLSLSGYDGSLDTQGPAAIAGIVAVNSWIPGILAFTTGLVALGYDRLEGRIKEISVEVLERRATAATAAGDASAPSDELGGTEAVRTIRAESGAPFTKDLSDD
ncbi:putative glucitol transport protein GutA [Microbacterium terrae]|uniref:Glucuronide carrier protein n=1 Tax=Microbacterium terrae TaxID=69369 RepID=A0A0M2H1Q1_9MICO|nr:MFS transporter [Microbacterium terrae]KJL37493.1 Glucuronide carrier protein [Microbacterium terrae]MBP1076322.1 putative glucitol transport protein GutA [Microbacterium terrae]GLJ97146.1 putative glucitol transport protein GutA [Microbacterium terrae]